MSEGTEHEEIVNQRWIAKKLRSIRMVEWDRFTTGEWGDEQYVNVYGWIERDDDDYKDFVNAIFWPANETVYHVTSSAEHTHEISQQLHGEEGDHNDCHRVEHTFNISNAVELNTEELVSDGGAIEDGTYRTNCDECGVPLFGTEGHEFGHGSYCEDCSLEYRTVDTGTDQDGGGR